MSDENKATIRHLYDAVFRLGDLDAVPRLYAEDAEIHIPGVPEDPFGGEPARRTFAMIRDAFPGIRCVVEDLIAEQDKVVARVTLRVPSGAMTAASPQARLAVWQRIDVFRLFRGQIVEHWADRDDLTALLMLGVAPPAERREGRVLPSGGVAPG